MTGLDTLVRLTAEVLDLPLTQVRTGLDSASFVGLGGSSLQAVRLSAEAARVATDLPLHRLLSREPVGAVLRTATPLPVPPAEPSSTEPAGVREALPIQTGMLRVEDFAGGAAYHLLFTADVKGVPADALPPALTALVARHEGLRTVFVPTDPASGALGRRVVPYARPSIREQVLRPPAGADPVPVVHAQLAAASTRLLRPFERPPVCFLVSRIIAPDGSQRVLLSIVVHHALADAWAIGMLFTELATLLAGEPLPGPAPSPDILVAEHRRRAADPAWADRLQARADRLRDAPSVLELPTDARRPAEWDLAGQRLPGTLRPAAVRAWRAVAAATGTTTTAVLLAAYALSLARRCGSTELLIGVPTIGRQLPGTHSVVAPCTQLVPVRCVLDETATAADFVTSTADALAEAVNAADITVEQLVGAIGVERDRRRNPLVQFVLGVHDELVPATVRRGDVTLRLYEGHCGGAPFDVTLFVQRGGAAPTLALEYATGAVTPDEAADLVDAVDAALVELADGLTEPLARARTISTAERERLDAVRHGPVLPAAVAELDLWSTVLDAARGDPDAEAVRDNGTVLTYAALVRLVSAQAVALSGAGIGDGDPVLLALPRGAAEVVAVLAVLAVGAHYVAIDPTTPDERLRTLLGVLPPAAIVAAPDRDSARFAARAEATCPSPVRIISVIDPRTVPDVDSVLAPQPPRGDRVAYVAFTSGSTGLPKAVRVPHRGVARLVWPGPDCVVHCGPGTRMLRLAPLAFDASTLELFAPLAAGGAIEVYPPGLATPTELAEFLLARRVTVMWLTSGLFRLIAEFAPDGFASTTHVLTGGDVVAPEQVRALLARYPGLRVTNGYGPTENTTFSAVAHVDDPSEVTEPLPIGTAIGGSGVLVLDGRGQPVPPGGVGELYVTGLGLALDYAGNPEQTAAAFGTAPDTGERAYRTGDLVRLAGSGLLQFLGRRDHQVKIRGFRVELDEIRRALADQPGVRDAVVVAVGTDASARRLVAGIVPTAPNRIELSEVAGRLGRALPGYAVPALWAVLDEIPLTRNGKVDAAALDALARPLGVPDGDAAESITDAAVALAAEPAAVPDATPSGTTTTATDLAGTAWAHVLGRPPSGPDTDFFRAGGDSLLFARLLAWLRTQHGVRIPARELYACPTPRRLSELIQPQLTATGALIS
jgi:amino acid adenylation domain-containing protein